LLYITSCCSNTNIIQFDPKTSNIRGYAHIPRKHTGAASGYVY